MHGAVFAFCYNTGMHPQASDYSVSFPFGATDAPYSPTDPHKGDDHACPFRTPLLINNLLVAYTGNTGNVVPRPTAAAPKLGCHLHIGKFKWPTGAVDNPRGGGFNLPDAYVWDIGQDSNNGKYIRIYSQGYLWVYCHLDQILVTKNQPIIAPLGGKGAEEILKEDAVTLATKEEIIALHTDELGSAPPQSTLDYYVGKKLLGEALNDFRYSDARKDMLKTIEIGTVARADAWDQQIYGLSDKLKAIQAKIDAGEYSVAREMCSINLSSLPTEDKTTIIGFIKSLFSRK